MRARLLASFLQQHRKIPYEYFLKHMMPSSPIFSQQSFCSNGVQLHILIRKHLRSVSLATSQLMAGDGFSAFFFCNKSAPFLSLIQQFPLA